jgi:ElaB/YqjD/DUF883 family membrane-anchored ribosome-binding protein
MMAPDVLVSRELKSLQDELSAAKTQRAANSAGSAATAAPVAPPTAAEPSPEPAEEAELQGQMRQFAHELTELFGETEKGISAHPAQSVAGALLIGILIGRLLGRR